MTALKDYGRYSLLKKLATGGMAEVFLARQKGLEGFEKLCVIKRILPHLADDAEFVTMFLNEARIAARFTHPNVAQIFDLGKEEGTYYIAMEFVHGEDLGRIMRQAWSAGTWLPLPIALRIVAQACEGLHYAHTKTDDHGQPMKVVHRDVSPQNVLVAFEGNAKIVDFGIARAADQVSTTRSGAIKGKFAYMSPEQASGKPLDARSDQFAIGLVLYEMLTGVRPFKHESDILTLKAAVECQIPLPSKVADVPADLDDIVMKGLAKFADDRYPDARGYQLALDSYITARGWTVTNAHVSEFMRELFAERLKKEEQSGEPMVHSSESQIGMPAASGTFPLPKKLPTHPNLLCAGTDGPQPLNPDAMRVATNTAPAPTIEPAKNEWGSQAQIKPATPPLRKPTSERVAAAPRKVTGSGLRQAVAPDALHGKPEPEKEKPRTKSAIRRAAVAAPEPAAKEAESGPPRTTSAEKRRKSVLHLSEAEIAEKERERQEAVRPARLKFGDDDDDEGATTAEPQREAYVAKGRPLWPLGLLLAAAVIGVSMVPAVRIRVMAILQSPCEEPGPVDTTALFLDVVDSASHHVPVEVWLGKKALGTTPLENAMVPEGELTLRLSNLALGIDRELVLHAKGSTLRPPKVTIALGRVSFHADKDCNVFILGNQVARANGPPLDFLEGTYEAECRNDALALIGKAKVVIPKDRNRIVEISFKLVAMPDQKP